MVESKGGMPSPQLSLSATIPIGYVTSRLPNYFKSHISAPVFESQSMYKNGAPKTLDKKKPQFQHFLTLCSKKKQLSHSIPPTMAANSGLQEFQSKQFGHSHQICQLRIERMLGALQARRQQDGGLLHAMPIDSMERKIRQVHVAIIQLASPSYRTSDEQTVSPLEGVLKKCEDAFKHIEEAAYKIEAQLDLTRPSAHSGSPLGSIIDSITMLSNCAQVLEGASKTTKL